jgi:hypothetical protein
MSSNETNNRKKRMLKALEEAKGIVTSAAPVAGINPCTHYDWIKNDKEYESAVEAVGNIPLDFVERKLFDLIEGAQREVMTDKGPIIIKEIPNVTAIIFYLKTKGKKRGYIDRTEITGADGKDAVNIIISKDL